MHSAALLSLIVMRAVSLAALEQDVALDGRYHGLAWGYSTLLGGRGGETVWDVAVGPDGSIYVVGQTGSADFPTVNAVQSNYGGNQDGFVARIAPDGRSLLYSTFVGGSELDGVVGVTVGPDGDAYVAGFTHSVDLPRGIRIHEQRGGGSDLFVMKIAPGGSEIPFATVVGGSGLDEAEDLALAPDGSLFVVGATASRDFPTVDAFQPGPLHGESDGVLLSLDSDTGELKTASYIGGSGTDAARALIIDRHGDAVVSGITDSHDFPGTEKGAQSAYGGGLLDVFIARVTGKGRTLQDATYLGGSLEDRIAPGGLSIDSEGRLILVGWTSSEDFPTVGPLQSSFAGWYDAFISVFEPHSLRLSFSTLLGGADSDFATQAVAEDGTIYVTGTTASLDFPLRCAVHDHAPDARYDAFIAAVDVAPPRLAYSTHVRGADTGRALARGVGEALVVAGDTYSLADFRLIDPLPMANAGRGAGFVMKLQPIDNGCTGDCCQDGRVSVDELLVGVNIALGTLPMADCSALDADGNTLVEIQELITAVRNAASDCAASE